MPNAKITGSARIGGRNVGGGSGTWRGLCLRKSGSDTFAGIDAVQFDTLVADSDAIVSTGSNTFGPVTVNAGAAGVVPSGMAGLWRLSLNMIVSNISAEAVETDIVVNNFAFFQPASIGDGVVSLTQLGAFSLAIASFVRELAEGDVVWVDVLPTTGSVDAGDEATLLMEYLGSVEELLS